jgi:hypothetical protein
MELYKKMLFDQWIVSLSKDIIITSPLETLKTERDTFINTNIQTNGIKEPSLQGSSQN